MTGASALAQATTRIIAIMAAAAAAAAAAVVVVVVAAAAVVVVVTAVTWHIGFLVLLNQLLSANKALITPLSGSVAGWVQTAIH